MGYFDESETFKHSCPGGIKKEPIVQRALKKFFLEGQVVWKIVTASELTISRRISQDLCFRKILEDIYSRLSRSFTARGSVSGEPAKGIRVICSRVTKLS